MNPIAGLARLCLAAALAVPVLSPAHAQPAPAASAADAASMTEGEVRRVDKEAGRISLRHGEIRNLDMPPMTMAFQVADPAMLDRVKAGDKVRFTAERVNGAFTLTRLDVVP